MEKYIINSVSEYLDVIKKIFKKENTLWFRGQENARWRLLPKYWREKKLISNWKGEKISFPSMSNGDIYKSIWNLNYLLNEFKRRAIPFLKYYPKNDLEWLILMQHYGVPTILLDWTTNPLIALYFAVLNKNCENYEQSEYNEPLTELFKKNDLLEYGACVCAINPIKLNKEVIEDKLFNIQLETDYEIVKEWLYQKKDYTYGPIAFVSHHFDERLRNQAGTFTIHGYNIWAIDYYTIFRKIIYKIFIPCEKVNVIREELKLLGITHSFVFPGLESIAKEITEENYMKN